MDQSKLNVVGFNIRAKFRAGRYVKVISLTRKELDPDAGLSDFANAESDTDLLMFYELQIRKWGFSFLLGEVNPIALALM